MLCMDDWQSRINAEFDMAETSRNSGNEGRARVCARRAAGIAIREYLDRNGFTVQSKSSTELLTILADSNEISSSLREIASHLTLKVSEDFKLPIDADLVDESRQLCRALLPDWDPSSKS